MIKGGLRNLLNRGIKQKRRKEKEKHPVNYFCEGTSILKFSLSLKIHTIEIVVESGLRKIQRIIHGREGRSLRLLFLKVI